MYINILICDDHKTQVDTITSFLKDFNTDYRFKIEPYTCSKELVRDLEKLEIDIAFLDIEMKPYDGIEIGKRIKSLNENAIIIYITRFKDYALNAFEVGAFNYLLKPLTDNRFKTLMIDLLLRYQQIKNFESNEDVLSFRTKENVINLKIGDIYCIEKIIRKIKIYTKYETYEFYGTLKQAIKHLDMKNRFVKVHQGYLANRTKIFELNKQGVYLRDIKLQVPVSRRYRVEVRNILEQNLF